MQRPFSAGDSEQWLTHYTPTVLQYGGHSLYLCLLGTPTAEILPHFRWSIISAQLYRHISSGSCSPILSWLEKHLGTLLPTLPHLCLYPRLPSVGVLPEATRVHLRSFTSPYAAEDECRLARVQLQNADYILGKCAREAVRLGQEQQQFGSPFQRRQPQFSRHSPLLDIF